MFMIIGALKKIINNASQRINRSIELNKYNDFTIAEYFRRQGAKIGDNNRIELRCLGAEPYLIRIGNHCTITPGVAFINHDGGTWIFTDEDPSLQKFGTIDIRDNCFIGLNSIIMGNIVIGPNSIVAAGSVVTKDVPPGTIVGGNPAKVISTIEEYKEKVFSQWERIKPQRYFQGMNKSSEYSPEYIQQIKYRDLDLLKKHLEKVCWSNESTLV